MTGTVATLVMSGAHLRASAATSTVSDLVAGLIHRPDLLIVTGDLSQLGLRSEYELTTGFLTGFAQAVGLPRRHVAIIPGSGDVNRLACEAHFKAQEAEEQPPVPPYFPKWRAFAAAFEEFYRDVPGVTFTPDEPWTLFEMPDLSVVVAGLNSTMAMSHLPENDYGLISYPQLNWFAARLADYQDAGWVRIAAIHHANLRDDNALDRILVRPGLVDMRVDGRRAAAKGAEMVTVNRHPLARQAPGLGSITANRDTWVAGRDIIVRTGTEEGIREESREDTFLARVAEATRLRFPRCSISSHVRGSSRYLRISDPLANGAAEVRPVGVIDGPATEGAVDRFVADIHQMFASADPKVRSELVYGAVTASPDLVRKARQQGVRLRSFIDYQGLLDLSPMAARQRQSLATDRLYPAQMYVDQRFVIGSGLGQSTPEVRAGLINQTTQWLSADAARLVVVLGDFGRGKTSFLKQLTRQLPDELPDLTPVLVELRNLEKGPTLADLVGQHLVRQGVEDFSQAKLRYMIESGRVALLFDGFDELELRVGYDTAADYLQTLLNSLTGQAKVVLTSRTQHFRSSSQLHAAVRTALGNRVESRTGSRVAILEDFTSEQILEFLTNLYDGDAVRAQRRLGLISDIAGLLELTRNPRMLAFVAELTDERLLAVRSDAGEFTAASLYQEIIDFWLATEEQRQSHSRGLAALTVDERFQVCANLALRLWRTNQPSISLRDLTAEVVATLTRLAERGFTGDQAAHSIASGSLLVRTEDDAFTFVHQSIMEWLVAAHAVRELTSSGAVSALEVRQMSRLMASFFRDLADPETINEWALITANSTAPDSIRQNAQAVISESIMHEYELSPGGDISVPSDLSGLDLRTVDINGRNLRGASLRGCNLRGMRIHDVNLESADLTEADFTGAVLIGGSLRGARLTGSRWGYAGILGTDGTDDFGLARSPELAHAAIAGRDHPEFVIDVPCEVRGIAFSPDGSLLVFGSGMALKIAEVTTGRVLRIIRGLYGSVSAMAFSSLSDIAVGTSEGSVHLWNAATGAFLCALVAERPIGSPGAHDGGVTDLAFSPNADFITTASSDGTVRAWDSATGTPHYAWSFNSPILWVEFSSATTLTVAYRDPTTQVERMSTCDVVTGVRYSMPLEDRETSKARRATLTEIEQMTFFIPGRSVTAITRSEDRSLVAIAYDDSRVVIRDGATGAQRIAFGDFSWTGSFAFSPGLSLIATSAPSDLARVWVTATGSYQVPLAQTPAGGSTLEFSPDSSLIAMYSDLGNVEIMETVSGSRCSTIPPPNDDYARILAVAFSPDESLIAVVHGGNSDSGDMKLHIYKTATGRPLVNTAGGDRVVHPDTGKTLIDTVTGKPITETTMGEPLIGLTGHEDVVTGMAFSPDGAFFATASRDGTARLWSTSNWKRQSTISGKNGPMTAVAFAPHGTSLATGYEDGTLKIFDMSQLRDRRSLRLIQRRPSVSESISLRAHQRSITRITFSSDGTLLVTASTDNTARIWTLANPTAVRIISHDAPVHAIEITAEGTVLASASKDGIAHFYDLAKNTIVATLVLLPDGGFATIFPGELSYKLNGDPGDRIWWALKLCRFGLGELDPYVPEIRRRPNDTPITR